ncbi:MAG: hypothetical protein WCY47_08370 [Pusillimonas sp.]
MNEAKECLMAFEMAKAGQLLWNARKSFHTLNPMAGVGDDKFNSRYRQPNSMLSVL